MVVAERGLQLQRIYFTNVLSLTLTNLLNILIVNDLWLEKVLQFLHKKGIMRITFTLLSLIILF